MFSPTHKGQYKMQTVAFNAKNDQRSTFIEADDNFPTYCVVMGESPLRFV